LQRQARNNLEDRIKFLEMKLEVAHKDSIQQNDKNIANFSRLEL